MTAGSRGQVLHLVGPSSGGIRQHVLALVPLLAERGRLSSVAAPGGVFEAGEFATEPESLLLVPVPAAVSLRGLWVAARSLRRQVDALPAIELIHAHGLKAAWVAWLARTGRPIVLTIHNLVLDSADAATARLLRRLESGIVHRVDRVIAGSPQARDRFAAQLPPGRLQFVLPVWPTPSPDIDVATVRAEIGVTRSQRLIVCVARHHRQKRLDLLIDAWHEADLPADAAVLAVVGEGPLTTALADQIERLGLRSVVLLGRRDPAVPYIAAADAFVLSSEWEGVPFVVAEAISLGIPVISTAVGMVPEFLPRSPLVVPVADRSALVGALRRFVEDPEPFRREAERSRSQLLATWGPGPLTEQVIAVYDAVLGP